MTRLVVGLAVSLAGWRALDWAVDFEAATMLRPVGLLVLVFSGSLMSVTGRGNRLVLPWDLGIEVAPAQGRLVSDRSMA